MLRSFALLILCGVGALPAAGACHDEKTKVTVVVILAGEQQGPIDERLKTIAAEVQKLNPQLKSFRLKTMACRSLDAQEKASFPLVEEQTAHVQVRKTADGENRVVLAVSAPDQGEIVYRTVCGKFLPIVTRYQTKSHERLILAIRVQPCQGD